MVISLFLHIINNLSAVIFFLSSDECFLQGGGFMDMFGMMSEMMENMVSVAVVNG